MILFLFSILLPPFEIDLNHNFLKLYVQRETTGVFFPDHFAFIRTRILSSIQVFGKKLIKDAHFQLYKIGNIYY